MMKKNSSLSLSEISCAFTEDTLQDILQKATGESEVKVSGWTFEPAASKGDNYLSVVYRVTIEGNTKDEIINTRVIVKAMLQNEGRNKTFRGQDFFSNEIYFYSKIVPMFEEFLLEKGKMSLLSVPRCFTFFTDGKNDFIVLEDAKEMGYEHISRHSIWKFEDCNVILECLARFHGISLALNNQKPAEFSKIAGQLSETLFSEKYWNWYKRFYISAIDVAKDAMLNEYGDTPESRKFTSMMTRDFFEKDVYLCNHRNKLASVINHGDSWASNFMTRSMENGKQEAIIFDFQCARWASPILDISYFIYTSTDKKTRDRHFDDLLKNYYDHLSQTVNDLGSHINEFYPWESFMKEVAGQFIHGLRFSLEALPAMMLDESEAFDLSIIDGDDAIDIAEIWKLQPVKNQAGRKRIADVVMHAIEHNFL